MSRLVGHPWHAASQSYLRASTYSHSRLRRAQSTSSVQRGLTVAWQSRSDQRHNDEQHETDRDQVSLVSGNCTASLALGKCATCFVRFSQAKVMLRPMVSRPVWPGVRNPSGALVGFLKWGTPCNVKLLLGLESAVMLRSESRTTNDHALLSQNRDSQIWRARSSYLYLNMIGVHPACVLKMLVFCNPSIHYACQVYHHFIVTTCSHLMMAQEGRNM
jgi:hypothetical protein